MRACFDAAEKHGLGGVLLWKYGPDFNKEGYVGIESNPMLVEEIRQAAEELGFMRAVRGAPSQSGTKAEPARQP